jgi:uncharacterized protein
MTVHVLLNLAVFAALIVVLARFGRTQARLSRRILAGLGAGVIYGFGLQLFYAGDPTTIAGTLEWTDVVGSGYVNLLRLIITPLVLVMMIAAVVRMGELAVLGRAGALVVGILIGTTMIAAMVGIGVANAFGLTAEGLTAGARELARSDALTTRYDEFAALGIADLLVRLVPSNVFADLAEMRPTSIIGVVVFGILAGVAALSVAHENPARGESIRGAVETAQAIVLKLVHLVMALTPYGIFALITRVVAGSNAADILNLVGFVAASYVAILIMFGVHAALLLFGGVRVATYFRHVWPVLAFAFTSRSSAATIPLNVETQVEALKVPVADRQSLGQLRRDDRPERLRRHLSGHAGRDDRAEHGRRSDQFHLHCRAGRDHRDQLLRRGGRGRRRDVRRLHRAARHGLPGHGGGTADLDRAADRHGSDGAQRQRLHDRRRAHGQAARPIGRARGGVTGVAQGRSWISRQSTQRRLPCDLISVRAMRG